MILVERLEVFADGVFVVKALGYKDSHCLWQRQSAHNKELKYVVKTCRVAHAFLYYGSQVLYVAQCLAVKHTLASLHPSAITTNSIYLTVVCQQSEGLCQLPLWECVGRESRVYQRQSACKVVVRQVREVSTQLSACQHALINDIFVRQRAYVEVLVVYSVFYALAYLI